MCVCMILCVYEIGGGVERGVCVRFVNCYAIQGIGALRVYVFMCLCVCVCVCVVLGTRVGVRVYGWGGGAK